jgi:hypothetical protein
MKGSDWAAVATGIGTFLLALATFRLAQLTKKALDQNRELIQTAKAEVEAAISQADSTGRLVQETKTDRELAWRPWLTLKSYTKPSLASRAVSTQPPPLLGHGNLPLDPSIHVEVQNIGRGLALNCRYVGYFSIPDEQTSRAPNLADGTFLGGRDYYRTEPFNLGAGEEASLQANKSMPGGQVTDAIHGTDSGGYVAEVNVLLCIDQFGRKYRFRSGKTYPDAWPPLSDAPPSIVTGAPTWTQSFDLEVD